MNNPDSTSRAFQRAALLVFLAAIFQSSAAMAQPQPPENIEAEDVREQLDHLEKPMYTPFIELYLLEESKALRKEMMNTRAELIEKVVDKELSVADKIMACAYSEIGRWEDAVATLQKAVTISEAYRDDASVDPSFAGLHENENFRKLVYQDDEETPES